MARRTSNTDKRRTGTDRPSRERPEPEPSEAILLPPGHLSDAAQDVWRRKAPELAAEGLLGSLDRENFGLWCTLQARVEERTRKGEDLGRDLLLSYRALSNCFGLNPDARSKLGLAKTKPPDFSTNKFAQVRKGR